MPPVCERGASAEEIKMEKPTDLNKFRKQQRKARGSGSTLCRSGFHQWQDEPKKQFDVKQGRLVSVQRCARCHKTRARVT
jgi:mono/diheme cytochrome c family protein